MLVFILAEAQGFEPWNPCGLPVFKTGAIDHSAKLPNSFHGGFKTAALNHSAALPLEKYAVRTICAAGGVVRKERLELSRLAALEPKSSASTNSATFAWPELASGRERIVA